MTSKPTQDGLTWSAFKKRLQSGSKLDKPALLKNPDGYHDLGVRRIYGTPGWETIAIELKDNIFSRTTIFGFGEGAAFNRLGKALMYDEKFEMGIDTLSFGRCIYKESASSIIFIFLNSDLYGKGKFDPNSIFQVGLLCHEVMHAVYAIGNQAGITLSDDSEELYSYYLQFLVEGFYAALAMEKTNCPIHNIEDVYAGFLKRQSTDKEK